MSERDPFPITPPLVYVEWDDAWSDSQMVMADSDYYEEPCPMFSVGFLKSEGEQVVICATWGPAAAGHGEHFDRCLSLPRGIIRRITPLRMAVGRALNRDDE